MTNSLRILWWSNPKTRHSSSKSLRAKADSPWKLSCMRMRGGGLVKVGAIKCFHRSDRIGVTLVATCTVQNQVKSSQVKIGSGPQIGKYRDVRASSSKIDPSSRSTTMEPMMQRAGSTLWTGLNHSLALGACHTWSEGDAGLELVWKFQTYSKPILPMLL